MARRRFEVLDVVEIYQHWDAGRPKAVIADSVKRVRADSGQSVHPVRGFRTPVSEAA
jgi:hypothetical protein